MVSNYIKSLIKSLVLLSVMISICCESTYCHPEQKSRNKINLPKIRYNQNISAFFSSASQHLPHHIFVILCVIRPMATFEFIPMVLKYPSESVSVDPLHKPLVPRFLVLPPYTTTHLFLFEKMQIPML